MIEFLDRHFHISERGSNVKLELIGGLTCFLAMAYILAVNAGILSAAGMPFTPLVVATAVSAAFGTLLTAFMANVPFAQAPGLGLNATFVYTLCMQLGYTWQQALAVVFISGLIFLGITLSPLRNKIVDAIPGPLKRAITVGIGLFITLIGLFNSGIVSANDNLLSMGNITSGAPLVAIIGLIITIILVTFKIKGAIFFSIILATLIGIPLGVTNTNITLSFKDVTLAPLFFKLSFTGLLTIGIIPLITNILTLTMCDMFDTVSTLIGCASGANMLDENGNMKDKTMSRGLIADAVATCTGALCGTSTVTHFVESATAVASGARTGLAAVVTGLLFVISIFFAPLFGIIPLAATAPALIMVGVYMMQSVTKIDFNDIDIAIPAFLTLAMIPFTYSLSTGLGFGFISWTIIKLVRGKYKEISPLMYVLTAVFILMFIL